MAHNIQLILQTKMGQLTDMALSPPPQQLNSVTNQLHVSRSPTARPAQREAGNTYRVASSAPPQQLTKPRHTQPSFPHSTHDQSLEKTEQSGDAIMQ